MQAVGVSTEEQRRERVAIERRLRGWSQRDAATEGGTSNQTWSTFERTGRVTDAVQAAVKMAFDWPIDWADNLPAAEVSANWQADVDRKISELYELLAGVAVEMEKMATQRAVARPRAKRSGQAPS